MVLSPVAISLILFIAAITGVSFTYCVQCGIQRSHGANKMRELN
ncbi:MAG: hypothetical protein R3C51_07315 [Parvularculaceae bacterium]